MRASYDSIDNKQKMCEKVNKRYNFYPIFPLHTTPHDSTPLNYSKIFFSLLTLTTAFLQKASWPGKKYNFDEQLSMYKYIHHNLNRQPIKYIIIKVRPNQIWQGHDHAYSLIIIALSMVFAIFDWVVL